MSCTDFQNTIFQDTLTYTAPSHGDWGLVRIASLLPESHMIFFCPSACGRHGALGAVEQGFKSRVAYCYLEKQDIVSGIDEVVCESVRHLLSRLPQPPRVVLLYVSCLDDLIGTDLDSLAHELAITYPHVRFRAGHMNPISLDGKTPPPATTTDVMYSLLDPHAKDNGVNFIGNLVPIDEDGELFAFLKFCGVTHSRHISHYHTFDAFQDMAKSKANLVLMPYAGLAAQNLKRRLGTPFMKLTVTYDLEEIADQYYELSNFLGALPEFDFSQAQALAERKIHEAKTILNHRPISISDGAVLKPFTLAKALLRYGFNVESVCAEEVLPFDENALEDVARAGVKVLSPTHTNVIRFGNRSEDAIAIGFDAAYITGSTHIVNLSNDHTLFGYHGVVQLMDWIVGAHENSYDLPQLLEAYGVVL